MPYTPQKVYSEINNEICRLFASAKDHSTNIFGKSGYRKQIEKICEFLKISISEQDGLPSKICRSCEGVLQRFSEFKTMVIETQNQLRSKVTTKRCKIFSPAACEPEKKVRAVEEKPSSAQSLFFSNDSANSKQSMAQRSEARQVADVDTGEKCCNTILSQAGLNNPELRNKCNLFAISLCRIFSKYHQPRIRAHKCRTNEKTPWQSFLIGAGLKGNS